jgi:hypothetical protein
LKGASRTVRLLRFFEIREKVPDFKILKFLILLRTSIAACQNLAKNQPFKNMQRDPRYLHPPGSYYGFKFFKSFKMAVTRSILELEKKIFFQNVGNFA